MLTASPLLTSEFSSSTISSQREQRSSPSQPQLDFFETKNRLIAKDPCVINRWVGGKVDTESQYIARKDSEMSTTISRFKDIVCRNDVQL
jgi:hypothetical protein